MQEYSMYIGGEFVTANHTFDVINPATGEAFAKCPAGSAEHVDLAVKAARAAIPGLGGQNGRESANNFVWNWPPPLRRICPN